MPTKLWAVRSALVDLFAEAVDVPVIDGPVAQTPSPNAFVLVGTDGGETGTGEASADGAEVLDITQNISGPDREERGEIVCAVWAWQGGTAMGPLREIVAANVALIEDAVAGDRKLGGVLAGGYIVRTRITTSEWQTPKGAVMRAALTFSFTAYLNS